MVDRDSVLMIVLMALIGVLGLLLAAGLVGMNEHAGGFGTAVLSLWPFDNARRIWRYGL